MNLRMKAMTNDNPCYRRGALWKTRTKLKAKVDGKKKAVQIPRGEMIMLLYYEMNISFEESIAFLWNQQVYYVRDVDTGLEFDLNPSGVNTKKNAS